MRGRAHVEVRAGRAGRAQDQAAQVEHLRRGRVDRRAEVDLRRVQPVDAVRVQPGRDARRVGREGPPLAGVFVSMRPASSPSVSNSNARPFFEVVGPDARLAAGVGAAAVDRAAAVAVADVRLAGAVRLRRGDHLGLAVGGPAAGVALALAQHAAGRADRERGHDQREHHRAGQHVAPLAGAPGAARVGSSPRSGRPPPPRLRSSLSVARHPLLLRPRGAPDGGPASCSPPDAGNLATRSPARAGRLRLQRGDRAFAVCRPGARAGTVWGGQASRLRRTGSASTTRDRSDRAVAALSR